MPLATDVVALAAAAEFVVAAPAELVVAAPAELVVAAAVEVDAAANVNTVVYVVAIVKLVVTVELVVRTGLALQYKFIRLLPPQYSNPFPPHGMLHKVYIGSTAAILSDPSPMSFPQKHSLPNSTPKNLYGAQACAQASTVLFALVRFRW